MQSRLLSLGLLAGSVLAQTPPYFDPSSGVNLPATFDANSTTPQFFVNGGVFARNATQEAPQLFLPANSTFSSNGTQPPTFIVLMVDPDAPSPQDNSRGEILHWLQPGVRLSRSIEPTTGPNGTQLAMLSASDTSTEAIVPYNGPQPPSVGPHRYIIMLFRQTVDDFELPDAFESYAGGENRTLFNATEFVQAADLDAPIAATYFLVGNGTTGDGTLTYTGSDAAAGIGGNTTDPTASGSGSNSSSSASGTASGTGASETGASATGTDTASGSAATQSGSGAEKLGVGALVGAVAGAMVLLG
ncbi:hypothetical protein SLS57_009827 [Botryosphaeria dothidea]